MMFSDRVDAGNRLALKMADIIDENTLVLAIPRGGVVIGHQIAKRYDLQLDVIVSKKLSPPGNPEFGIGAITYDGITYLSDSYPGYFTQASLQNEISKKKAEVEERQRKFRGNSEYDLANKNVIVVDDGIATGSTVIVVVEWLKTKKIARASIASPVIAADMFELLKQKFQNVFAVETPTNFMSISDFYTNFNQVSDEEVLGILKKYT
jgi:predicted phosphoribosyltransferase|tara:strand:+ start:87 stop:710 length:624 start_codon:yes stop_codon:yes gene_type:complete